MAHRLVPVSEALAGRYAIGRELGRGGMATVYLAEDLKLHRKVALKLLQPQLAAALGSERFLREIEIAARLSHPHILALHDAGEAGGQLFYAMPYVQGESLRQRLEREPQLPVDETVRILRAVAGALDAAHRAGVVHRDIKPENILLAADPGGGPAHPLVADFGIARALTSAGGERLTETGLALGTPTYMSPEQAAASDRLDGRSDIYALGCVAYEMLAGAPPFTGPTPQAILARHAVDPLPPLRTVRAVVPESVALTIERALAKVPADRFATAAEFAAALDSVPSVPRRHTRVPRVAALGLLTLAATAGLATVLLRGSAAPAVLPSAATIAVLPFAAPSGDTTLTRLARDLAITIDAGLDGVGEITTADRPRLAAATAERPVHQPADAARLAREVGAGSVLMGTIIRNRARVRLDFRLYDAVSVAALIEGVTITAHEDSLAAVTDSVVWSVLRQVWRRGEPPTPSLAAVTTRSIPALRAFLQGERAFEEGRYSEAGLAFGASLAADSAFRLAQFRYLLVEGWEGKSADPRVADLLSRHREALPEPEQMLLDGWRITDSVSRELGIYEELTTRHPDYWPGWLFLGDGLFHSGILLGHDWSDAQGALGHAVRLNPRLWPAWEHMFQNSAGKDPAENSRVLEQILRIPIHEPASEEGEDQAHLRRVWRLTNSIARSGGVIPPASSELADSVVRYWVSLDDDPSRRRPAPWGVLWSGFPAALMDWNRRVLRLGPEARWAANQHRAIAWAWTQRGAWDSALVSIRSALDVAPDLRDPTRVTPLDEYGLAVLGAWLGALDRSAAADRRGAARAMVLKLGAGERKAALLGTLAWLDGVWAFAAGDATRLERARRDGRESRHPHADIIDRSLAAFARALAGDRAGAGRDLAALEWRCAERQDCGGVVTPNIAVHRLAAASWLLEAGDSAQAARLLTWHEAPLWSGGWDMSLTFAAAPLAYLMLARIEEAQGNARMARAHYQAFLRRYDSPMPGQRHLVEEARAALSSLSGRDGSGGAAGR
jgi:TolB-like protein/tRNA A-37 threonylcarbamoyl transferase component Bud32